MRAKSQSIPSSATKRAIRSSASRVEATTSADALLAELRDQLLVAVIGHLRDVRRGAAARAGAHPVGLEHRDAHPVAGEERRGRQPRQAGTEDRDVDREVPLSAPSVEPGGTSRVCHHSESLFVLPPMAGSPLPGRRSPAPGEPRKAGARYGQRNSGGDEFQVARFAHREPDLEIHHLGGTGFW